MSFKASSSSEGAMKLTKVCSERKPSTIPVRNCFTLPMSSFFVGGRQSLMLRTLVLRLFWSSEVRSFRFAAVNERRSSEVRCFRFDAVNERMSDGRPVAASSSDSPSSESQRQCSHADPPPCRPWLGRLLPGLAARPSHRPRRTLPLHLVQVRCLLVASCGAKCAMK